MKKLDHKRLAEGEVTGHFHAATAASATLYEEGGRLMLDAPEGTDITHQEHKPITLPAGQYDRLLVQEFDPFEEEVRAVRD